MATAQIKPFDQLAYQRIEYEYLANELRRARIRLRMALTAAAAAQAIHDMQTALRIYRTQAAIARIRHDRQTDDSFYAEEQAYYDQADARVALLVQSFYSTMLLSRHRPELEIRFGSLIFRKAENLRSIVRSAVVDDLAEENRLSSAYLQLMSAATVRSGEETLALSQLAPMLQSPDRQVRIRAHKLQSDWHQEHGESLDHIFDQMVAARCRISQKLNLPAFTDLGYKRMERLDYSRQDVENVRRAVLRYIVPLTREIRRLQRRRLGVDVLRHYDLPCLYPAGNPEVLPDLPELASVAAQVIGGMKSQDPTFFRRMADGGYVDLIARQNKTTGGYCSTIINAGMTFILMNASGTAQDVTTLMHEAGHAYAGQRSLQDDTLLEYLEPTLDACEIHSTAFEYFSYPHMTQFFGADAENYTLLHMTEALLFIPYGCLVDEFQHVIYDQPGMTSEQRHLAWRELEKVYLPDVDYADAPYFEKGGAWHRKEHIFVSPFYYIDYVLAQLAAIDLWQTSRKAPDKAWRCYEKLCALGGRESFASLLAKSGIASPFDSGTIKRVAYAASTYLEL